VNDSELRELSRKAAGCLPNPFLFGRAGAFVVNAPGRLKRDFIGKVWNGGDAGWLHESTEACTEIMVRVLGRDIVRVVVGSDNCVIFHSDLNQEIACVMFYEVGEDPMLAFRVAVLRALVALKGEKL